MKHSSGGKEGKAILGPGKTMCKCKDCKQGVDLRDLQVSGRLCFCVMAGGVSGSRIRVGFLVEGLETHPVRESY